jgi:signal peptidase II
MSKKRYFWIAAIASLILDQLTKYWVVRNFSLSESWSFWEGVFHFTYVRNTGAAFSFFTGGAFWLRWLSLIVSAGIIIFIIRVPKIRISEQLGLGFILAGALGNGIDRFLFGYVVDFLDVRLINFPVFNIADACINIGLVFLIFTNLQEAKK